MAEDKSSQPKIEFCEKCLEERKPAARKAPLYAWGQDGCPLREPLCWEHWKPNGEQVEGYKGFIELLRINLNDAHLENANLVAVDLEGANLTSAHLERANLYKACLKEAVLWLAHLKGANLTDSELEGAMLTATHFEGACLHSANLKDVQLSRAHMEGADLNHTRLDGADLGAANLDAANLRSAHLDGAKLGSAYLKRTDLSGAMIEGADLTNIQQKRYTLWVMFRDAFRRKKNRIRITRWDSVSGIDTARTDSLTRGYIKWVSYIEDLRARHPCRARFWGLSCFYGQPVSLVLFWGLVLAIAFGAVYADYPYPSWLPQWPRLKAFLFDVNPKIAVFKSVDNWLTPYYYSIVTFTTLGFGDVLPQNTAAQFWVMIEVVLGYVVLGFLVWVLTNKFGGRA